MKRIAFAAAVTLAALAGASEAPALTAAAPAPAPPAEPVVTEVAKGVYYYNHLNYSSMFVVTPAGVLATDPDSLRNPARAERYLAEIRKITQAPIKYLVYSHSHYDHSAGGKPFKAAGATIVAHKNAKERLDRYAAMNPDVVPVDLGVGDNHTLTLGGTKIQLLHLSRSHTDNMLVLLLPKERIAYTVDWVSPTGPPSAMAINVADSYPADWIAGLKKLEALGWDKMIPGHGGRLIEKTDVAKTLAFMTDANEIMKGMAASGKCNAAGKAAQPIPAQWVGYVSQNNWNGYMDRLCYTWNYGL